MLLADDHVPFLRKKCKIPEILHWGITKKIKIGVSIIIDIFCPQFLKCCLKSKTKGNILRTLGEKFSVMTSTPVTICILLPLLPLLHWTVNNNHWYLAGVEGVADGAAFDRFLDTLGLAAGTGAGAGSAAGITSDCSRLAVTTSHIKHY